MVCLTWQILQTHHLFRLGRLQLEFPVKASISSFAGALRSFQKERHTQKDGYSYESKIALQPTAGAMPHCQYFSTKTLSAFHISDQDRYYQAECNFKFVRQSIWSCNAKMSGCESSQNGHWAQSEIVKEKTCCSGVRS